VLEKLNNKRMGDSLGNDIHKACWIYFMTFRSRQYRKGWNLTCTSTKLDGNSSYLPSRKELTRHAFTKDMLQNWKDQMLLNKYLVIANV